MEYSGVDEAEEDHELRQSEPSRLVDGCCSGELVLAVLWGEAKRPFSWKSSSPPATRWNSGSTVSRVQVELGTCVCNRTGLASPHIPQDLNVTRDLLLGAVDAMFLEMLDEELVAPATAAARIRCPGRLPVLVEACNTSE